MLRPSLFALLALVCLLAAAAPGAPRAAQADAKASGAASTVTGISNRLNPAISVNGLFWAQVSRDDPSPERNRIDLQEAELQFSAVVDPFWKAVVTAAIHPAHRHGESHEEQEEAHGTEAGFSWELEEAYVEGRFLPGGWALRLGRMYLPLGKHPQLHTHQYPFVEAPLGIRAFLGDHPLNENGAAVTASLPLPWFGEATVYGLNGDAELFDRDDRDLVYGGRLRQLWDLGASATLELGGSAFRGPDGRHPGEGKALDVYGVDLTCKWIAAGRSHGPALTLQGELLLPRPEERTGDPRGWYALAQYRLHRNWWLGATVGEADGDAHAHEHEEEARRTAAAWSPRAFAQHEHALGGGKMREYKLNLAFAPSEFSAVRAEVAWYDDRLGEADDLRFLLQWNFTIGSHPAHHY